MVKLLLGLIIGHMTETTACVLLDVDEEMPSMECVLHEVGNWPGRKTQAYIHVAKKDMPARVSRVFKFDCLLPNSCYKIRVPTLMAGCDLGEVRTMPEDLRSIQVGIVSCDKRIYKPEKINMWQAMWERYKNKKDDLRLLLHISDNVYIDHDVSHGLSNSAIVADDEGVFDEEQTDQMIPYVQGRKILHDCPKEKWPSKLDEVLEVYHKEYRKTFWRKWVADVLAHVSNLMILDDHDFRDDFGSVPEDGDPESAEFFLGRVGLTVYHEYQHALWDPDIVDRDISRMTSEFCSLTFGSLGIMMLDSRPVWSTYKPNRDEGDTSYYENQQMASVHSNLENNKEVSFWIMVCPLPLFFLKKKLNEIMAEVDDRADDLFGTLRKL